MTNLVTLESYSEEIRVLIHGGRNDEAIGICTHILHYYPKHVETYRQLGEAYLDKGDLDGAKEMFRRVLSADPESIIAYAGLATVFEQQQLIDEAVWHLERAYEIALNNPDIHKELLRLYAEAKKPRQRLKMAPAGLARLYAQEGLYPQAIQELRGVVEQSATRFDARVALAEILWRAGRAREATEVAQALLTSLPYCLKANLILGAVWKESGVSEFKSHLDRAQELDPTNKVAQKLFGSRSPLPVVRVDVPPYGAGEPNAPGFASAPSADETPSDLFGSDLQQGVKEPLGSTDSGAAEPAAPVRSSESNGSANSDAAAAIEDGDVRPQLPPTNLPPWLMPQLSGSVSSDAAPSDDLQNDENAHAQAVRDDSEIVASRLDGKEETAAMTETERLDSDTSNDDDLPDWLRDLQAKAPPATEPSASDSRASETGLPTWLEAPGDTPASQQRLEQSKDEDLPDWLRNLHPETAQDTVPTTVNAEPTAESEEEAPSAP
ncbi:MAG: tetratricopeptide repeat protein, partial [Chloroflexi bacterium]|nr:tetratricopeptide repeat protein [Chloroflexota bacterium]